MSVDQLSRRVGEFASYLDAFLGRLRQDGGWCAVFWRRDPDGMRACLAGVEVPPWDVVEALLQDLAAAYGSAAAAAERERALTLHTAAVAAFDARPGARDALGDHLEAMLRAQRDAVERQAELALLLAAASTREEADALRVDLAWAHDDHDRAAARCTALRARLTALDRPPAPEGDGRTAGAEPPGTTGGHPAARHPRSAGTPDPPLPGAERTPRPADRHPAPSHASASAVSTAPAASAPGPESPRASVSGVPGPRDSLAGRPGRFTDRAGAAGRAGPDAVPAPDPSASGVRRPAASGGAGTSWFTERTGAPASRPEPPGAGAPAGRPPGSGGESASPGGKTRKRRRGSARFAGMVADEGGAVVVPQASGGTPGRGARFAGAAERAETGAPAREAAAPADPAAEAAVAATVRALVRLRTQGRSGEAHALLVECAYWPAARLPLLADALEPAGLGADWGTLLWEAASLPAEPLVAAAEALTAAGRPADGRRLLRLGVVRPAAEIGAAVVELDTQGRGREALALLDAYVRVRAPEEAARSVVADPGRLVPLLLRAARGVSEEREWDLVHALRVAGHSS
ncbi:hypothetical protein [Streptomyces collinus]|uniref:hypothetical protein n=1 Tax=Streptomyces collinus TaxID=42684 RepID=UPI0036E2CED6